MSDASLDPEGPSETLRVVVVDGVISSVLPEVVDDAGKRGILGRERGKVAADLRYGEDRRGACAAILHTCRARWFERCAYKSIVSSLAYIRITTWLTSAARCSNLLPYDSADSLCRQRRAPPVVSRKENQQKRSCRN